MKKSLNIQINFTNRVIYTFIAFTIFILAGVAVFAFGTSSPSTFGHSAAELDLSGGVNGDALFNGNLNVSGNIKTNGNIDVVGAIKIGSAATCNTNTEGTLRYNSVDKNMEVCNSTKWKGMGTGGTGGIIQLVNGVHTTDDCLNIGGFVTLNGTDYFCKVLSAPSCPTGWTQYLQWSTTNSATCATAGCEQDGCSTSAHTWANKAPEICSWYQDSYSVDPDTGVVCDVINWNAVCTAGTNEIGCY